MKLHTITFMLAFVVIGVQPTKSNAQAFIVTNGVTMQPNNGVFVIQDPLDGDYTGFFLQSQNPSNFLFSPLLDEGVRVFQVGLNDPITTQSILAPSFSELTFPNIYDYRNGTSFYLGFYTGNSFPVNGIYDDPLFGWGRFRNNNGTIQLLDSALAYGGGGIIAGTQTILPVPEPSAFVLGGVGLLLAGFCRWRTVWAKHEH